MGIITLLTDFDTRDEYVGVLKGVIYGIDPTATIVDLTHRISPQDVVAASFLLRAAWPYFPAGTIHVAVVDPGVGGGRAILASSREGRVAIAPDNGLLRPLWAQDPPEVVVRIENQALFRHPVSRTFHGRDIMAPAAAHLSRGTELSQLGPRIGIERTVELQLPRPVRLGGSVIRGEIVWIDTFGNLITNITAKDLAALGTYTDGASIEVQAGGLRISGLSDSYDQVPSGRPLSIVASRECLEIAINQGSAAAAAGLGRGSAVTVSLLMP